MNKNESKIVESIIDHRKFRGKDRFRVKWKDESETTWEPVEKLFEFMDKVDEYLSKKKGMELKLIIYVNC